MIARIPPPRHAPLATRKAVFTRTAVLEAFADLENLGLGATEQAEGEAACDQLLQQCHLRATRQTPEGLPVDSERLDTTAKRLGVDAQGRAMTAESDGSHALARVLRAAASNANLVDCELCAELGGCGPPCGEDENRELVDRQGHCLADLKRSFEFGMRIGTRLYDDALAPEAVSKLVPVQLGTGNLSRRTPGGGHIGLAARTEFPADGDRHRSVIMVDIDGSTYGREERDATVYLVTHEVVAHAFYDAFSPTPRLPRDPYDAWSEGWMDCVAHDVLCAALTGLHIDSGSVPERLRGNQGCIDVCGRLHAGRYEPRPGSLSYYLNGMRLARKRYMAMKYRLHAYGATGGFDPMRTVHLACALVNAKGAADDTVAAINSAAAAFSFGGSVGGALNSEERRFQQAMSSFLLHRDEARLIGDLR